VGAADLGQVTTKSDWVFFGSLRFVHVGTQSAQLPDRGAKGAGSLPDPDLHAD